MAERGNVSDHRVPARESGPGQCVTEEGRGRGKGDTYGFRVWGKTDGEKKIRGYEWGEPKDTAGLKLGM